MRYQISRAFFVLALLTATTAAIADGGFGNRPPLTFRHDDRTVSFGNTQAAPDVSISWETTGAEDHLSAVVASGAGLLVSSDADVDRSGSLAAGSTYLGVCSDDEASPTECLVGSHDGTDGIVASASGRLVLAPTGGLTSIRDANADYFVTFSGTDPLNTNFVHNANAQNGYITTVSQSYLQTLMAIRGGAGTAGGRQLIIGEFDNRVIDHDHATPTDPTLFIHSATSPDTDNTQWLSLSHDQTNAIISSGAGRIALRPASSITSIQDSAGTTEFTFNGAGATTSEFNHNANNQTGYSIAVAQALDQNVIGVRGGPSTSGGRQLILSEFDNRALDHDHATPTDPTLFIHSATSPDTDNTQWVSLAHNQTNAVLGVGKGALSVSASLLLPDDGTIGSASDADAVKLTAVGNLAHRGAITLSTSTSDIDLTSTTHSTTFILDAVMADGQAITLPQPTAALAGMVIDIHLMQNCATSIASGTAIGLANGGSATLKGSLTLSSTGAKMDVVAIPSSQKALWLDSDSEKQAGGAAGSHYQFIYAGGTSTVYVKGQGMTTHATPALDANYAFGGGYGTS